jgi:hypothetical protein
MGSTKCKRAGVVAVLAASLTIMMGGTAFASSPSTNVNPASPGEIPGSTYATVVTILADNTPLL